VTAPAPGRPSETATRDRLANERTYLAWVRTAVTFVGLGFAVDRLLVDDPAGTVLGIVMMVAGGGMMIPALLSYRRTERAIASGMLAGPMQWGTLLAVLVAGGAAVLVLYSLLRGA
jgi:putative membrane protein